MKPFGILLVVLTTLFPAAQLFALPALPGKLALFSQYLGLAALILMAWGQILSTRLPGIETLFGGLDRVYVLHKWAGLAAMVALLAHDTIDADMAGLGRTSALNELAETLGEISLYGLLVLVVISVATFIPYHLWRWTHKAMGALFTAGVLHFVFIMKPFAMSDPAGIYTGIFCILGIAAYIWMMLPERLRPGRPYKIKAVHQTGGAVAITLRPVGTPVRPSPGQFGVLRFTGAGLSEPHPFSFSRIRDDGEIRVTIKAQGDFTMRLGHSVEPGQLVQISGPFGRFKPLRNGPCIWIAGGIGITPFLACAEALPRNAPPVDLFYCVRSRRDAAHLDELETLAADRPNLRLHLFVSAEGQRLDADRVAATVRSDLRQARVYYCGPAGLREALRRGLARHGLNRRRFQFEEFEFRTGIGLNHLAELILARTQRFASRRASELKTVPEQSS